MSRKVVPLLVIGLVLAMVLGACAPQATPAPTQPPAAATEAPTQPPAAETKVLKVGVLGPFSGPAARTGEEFKGSVQMTLDEINGQVGNYKIEVVWIDSQSDPAKAAQAYEQAAVQDQIQAGVLNWHSSVAVSCMDVAAKYKIPHFFGFGATEVVNEKFASDPEKYSYWMIKGWPAPAKLSISYVQALEDAISKGIWKPAEKTVAIYGEDTDWGRSFGGAIKKQLQDAGWKIVAEEYFPIEQTEFYPILNKFKELNPALVAGTSTAAPVASAFIKQADEVGLKSLLILDGLGWVGEWYQLTGKSSDYVLDQIPGWTTPEAKEFAEKFKARFGIDPSPSAAGLSYDGMHLFVEVLKNTLAEYGELNRETIYKWARENIHTGKWSYKNGVVMREYKYTPETIPDPVVGQGYYIFPVLQYFDGVGKVIFPPEWAEQELKVKP
ncbi:MAG: ABC transporter substrate-binding protein [Anaerolineae bacterium]|nr:ABC transporter substrate-binding protein [Anaerolineae bacterium]